jgi:hypothetical protein
MRSNEEKFVYNISIILYIRSNLAQLQGCYGIFKTTSLFPAANFPDLLAQPYPCDCLLLNHNGYDPTWNKVNCFFGQDVVTNKGLMASIKPMKQPVAYNDCSFIDGASGCSFNPLFSRKENTYDYR